MNNLGIAPSTALFRLLALVTMLNGAACSAEAEAISNDVQMIVSVKGFEPRDLAVHAGKPVNLTITRKTNDTCANEIVIDEYGINVKLPLNQPVKVSFTPKKPGTLKYGCAMSKMIGGVISVR